MQFYKTTQVTRLAGIVGLSDAQAKARARRLTPVKGRAGVYELPAPLDFKAGELVGFDEVPKALRRILVGGNEGDAPAPHDPKTGEPIAAAPAKASASAKPAKASAPA